MAATLAKTTTIFSILSICNAQQTFDYNNWILPSSPKFPQESGYHAVGYSNKSNTFWLLGAIEYPQQLISFKNDKVTDHGQSNLSEYIYGTGQFYAQTDSILWMINNPGTAFITFNVDTLQIDYKYNNISITETVSSFSALAANSQYLFVLGRRVGNTYYNTVQMFDLISNEWITNVPFMTTPRLYAASVIHNGFLYAIGGYYFVSPDSYYLSSIERLYIGNASHISSYSWDIVGNLTIGRYGLRAVSFGSDIIVIGGYKGLNDYITAVDVIDTTTNPLQVRNGGDLKRAAAYAAVIQANSIIYVFGGKYVWGGPTYIVQNSDMYQYAVITTVEPTIAPSNPSLYPSTTPTNDPSNDPSIHPTKLPTVSPTYDPTTEPTVEPTFGPSDHPSVTLTTSDATSASISSSESITAETIVMSDVHDISIMDAVDELVISWIGYVLCVICVLNA